MFLTAQSKYSYQIIIIGIFFFTFGFITWINATLIQYLTIACNLQQEWQSYLVTFAFYISYTVLAFPSGMILRKTGMVRGMQLGLVIMAAGCLLFIAAAVQRSYSVFLSGLFIIGAGLTILQTAVNPYVTFLGPSESAAQRISIMGICNKSAGVLAPLIFGAIILSNADQLQTELSGLTGYALSERLDLLSRRVIAPYSGIATGLIALTILLKYAHLPEIKIQHTFALRNIGESLIITRHPALMLGSLSIFFSVASEVITADSIGRYGQYQGFSLDVSKTLTSVTLLGMIAGYITGILTIPKIVSQETAFMLSNTLGILLTIAVIFLPGVLSIYCLAALGFANAMLWPAIWPTALRGLSAKWIHTGSAILIMGIAGGAVMPLLYGVLADFQNKQQAYWILLPGYIFNILYWKLYMKMQVN